MAIAVDVASEVADPFEGVTSASWSHAGGSGDGYIVFVCVGATAAPSGVTYGGNAMTQVGSTADNGSRTATIWRYAGLTGTQTVAVTFGESSYGNAGAVSFTGVDTSSPIRGTPQANTSGYADGGANWNVTTESGDTVLSCLSVSRPGANVAGGETLHFEGREIVADGAAGAACSEAATTTTTNISWSWTGAGNYAALSAALIPAAAASTPIPLFMAHYEG